MSALIQAIKAGNPVTRLINYESDVTDVKEALILAIAKKDAGKQHLQNIHDLYKHLLYLAGGRIMHAEHKSFSIKDAANRDKAILALAEINWLISQKILPEFEGWKDKQKAFKEPPALEAAISKVIAKAMTAYIEVRYQHTTNFAEEERAIQDFQAIRDAHEEADVDFKIYMLRASQYEHASKIANIVERRDKLRTIFDKHTYEHGDSLSMLLNCAAMDYCKPLSSLLEEKAPAGKYDKFIVDLQKLEPLKYPAINDAMKKLGISNPKPEERRFTFP